MIETICFVSNDEDRAAALNMIQLDYERSQISKSLLKHGAWVSIKGKVVSTHVGYYFKTPYAIEVIKATKQQ